MQISPLLAIPLLATLAVPFAAQASVKTAIAQSQMSSLKSPLAQRSTDADLAKTLYEDFAEIAQRPCDGGRKIITEKSNVYIVCFTNIGDGKASPAKFISYASTSHVEFEDGIGYWYHFNAKVAAIKYFHTGELFFFDRIGTLQAELIHDDNRSVRTKFSKTERDHLEKLAREGGADILSKFK